MNSQLRNVAVAALVLLVLASGLWLALRPAPVADISINSQVTGSLQEGVHFRVLKNPPAKTDSTVTVSEYFWYGCPHCRSFEPHVHRWQQSSADDVTLKQVPVVWNDMARLHAAIYYVGLGADNSDKLHQRLFDQIIDIRSVRNIEVQKKQLAVLFAEHGISAEAFNEALASDAVLDQVTAAEKAMRDAEISSTPSMVVDHRWVVLNNEQVGEIGVFNVIDALIEHARKL